MKPYLDSESALILGSSLDKCDCIYKIEVKIIFTST